MNTPRHTGLGRGLGDLLQRTDPELAPHHDADAGRSACPNAAGRVDGNRPNI